MCPKWTQTAAASQHTGHEGRHLMMDACSQGPLRHLSGRQVLAQLTLFTRMAHVLTPWGYRKKATKSLPDWSPAGSLSRDFESSRSKILRRGFIAASLQTRLMSDPEYPVLYLLVRINTWQVLIPNHAPFVFRAKSP